jgi:transcriptional regulator
MYTPEPFAECRPEVLHSFIREHPLGLLISCSNEEGLTATHVPMLLDVPADSSGVLRCHVARANPHQSVLAKGAPVLVVFQGPDHYITPSWYPSKAEHGRVVPTWNYVAVHVWGQATVFDDHQALLHHVGQMTEFQESVFTEPWRVTDAPQEYVSGLARAIVGIEIRIERMQGKWKLSQNRPAKDRTSVVDGLEDLATCRSVQMADAMKKRQAE